MTEFVLFCIPTIVYVLVQSRGPDRTVRRALGRAGVARGSLRAYGWALATLVPLLVAAWLAIELIPRQALDTPGVSVARITSAGSALSIVLRALGEEVFFRGLLGGVLIRRLGFWWGNLFQSVIFLLPHLTLLAIDVHTWPILPVQFVTGWVLGWLRNKTGTLLPGAAIHAIANVVAGLIAG